MLNPIVKGCFKTNISEVVIIKNNISGGSLRLKY